MALKSLSKNYLLSAIFLILWLISHFYPQSLIPNYTNYIKRNHKKKIYGIIIKIEILSESSEWAILYSTKSKYNNLILSYLINKRLFRLSKKGQLMNISHKIDDGGNNQGEAQRRNNVVNSNQNFIIINVK